MEKRIYMHDYINEEQAIMTQMMNERQSFCHDFVELLIQSGARELVITGSGTSYHAALATRQFLEKVLGMRVRAEYPMIFKDSQGIYDTKTLVLGISQGGQSESTVSALRMARQKGSPVAAISENPTALVFECSDVAIIMACGPELSVAKTKGYQATMMMLMLLGLEAGLALRKITKKEHAAYEMRLRAVVDNLSHIITAATAWVEHIQSEMVKSRRVIVLGYRNNYANVLEGALKMLETMRFGIYGYDIEEFYHGIYNSVDSDTYLIYLASEGEYREKVVRLHEVMRKITTHQFVVSSDIAGYRPSERDCILPFLDDPDFSVLEYGIPLQLVSAKIPYALGIDPFFASDPEFHYKVGSKQRANGKTTC